MLRSSASVAPACHNFAAPVSEQLTLWAGVLTLRPVALLMLSGLYLFVLPYVIAWRSRRRTAE